jgi:hypothetical protein
MNYEHSVKLVECLQKIEETINLRPHNWLLFSANPPQHLGKSESEKDVVPYLLQIVFYLREEAALLVLKLLVALFADENNVCCSFLRFLHLISFLALFLGQINQEATWQKRKATTDH